MRRAWAVVALINVYILLVKMVSWRGGLREGNGWGWGIGQKEMSLYSCDCVGVINSGISLNGL